MAYHLVMVDTSAGDFLFPTFGAAAVKESLEKVDSQVSKLWSDIFAVIVDLYEAYTEEGGEDSDLGPLNVKLGAHNGKKGANAIMSDSPAAGFPQIDRSGWVLQQAHTIFDYVYGTVKMDTKSAKVLAGWLLEIQGYIFGGYPPEPKHLTETVEKFGPFVSNLFINATDFSRPLLELLAMSVLLRYDDVVEDIKKEPRGRFNDPSAHPFVAIVRSAMAQSCVSDDEFASWKRDTKRAFVGMNKLGLAPDVSDEMRNVLVDPRPMLSSIDAVARATSATQGELGCTACLFPIFI